MLFKKRAIEAIRDHNGQLPPPNEILELSKLIPTVHTNVKIETFDALTGKLRDFDEGHNFLSIDGQNYLTTLQKAAFNIQHPFSSMNYTQLDCRYANDGLWRYLYLSDSALPESPTTERGIPGNIVGYASKLPYTGTNIKIGNINQNECYATNELSRFVFDFATDRGNGVIQSVGFCKAPVPSGYYTGTNGITGTAFYRYNREAQILLYAEGYYWATVGNILYKLDPTTFAELDNYTLPYAPAAMTILNGFAFLFHTTQNAGSYRYDLANKTQTRFPSEAQMQSVTACGNDGTYVYTGIHYNGLVTRIDPTTLAITTKVLTTPAGYTLSNPNYFCSVGGVLYACGTQNSITVGEFNAYGVLFMKVNWAAGTLDTTDFFAVPGDYSYAQFGSDGTYLYYPGRVGYYYNSPDVMKYTYSFKRISIAELRSLPYPNMMTRKRLAEPIIKNNTKTMKVTYDVMFT